ncbi:site-specific integrase (plasmid) [Shewanella xiamenensis]|uniref:Site-specific integrase n=1 Tax=Shewanella xiamenensis TaxID=332186 RepID=A0ABT6UDS1_9GAMM|nr:site-specific integrase [Shewanella xiamenensis]MDI5832597.1 site-specific integrase [Shewanella xiamenensis]WHF57785.1 site-specific integrase [Shewanella xiamenensis]
MITSYFDTKSAQDTASESIGVKINKHTVNEIPDAYFTHELFCDYLSEISSDKHWKTARTELNTFMIWCFDIESISVSSVKRQLLKKYIDWCSNPPADLIGTTQRPQFVNNENGLRVPNPDWKPFVKRSAKSSTVESEKIEYKLKNVSIKNKLSILSSLYNFLIDCEYVEHNPAQALLKTLGRRVSGSDEADNIRSFTKRSYEYILKSARKLADESPENERILFAITIMFTMYPRISEISARNGFTPLMSQFRQNENGNWFFYVPRSKFGKSRMIAVSNDTLDALKRYRHFLGLPSLPTRNEETPLLVRMVAAKHGRAEGIQFASIGEKQLWTDVQKVLAEASNLLFEDGYITESEMVKAESPHSFRHTGISADVNWHKRDIAQVRDDAGHSSINTTSRYLWTQHEDRYLSAKDKQLDLN